MSSIQLASIDLNLLVAFEALFEERSVTSAAGRLHLGQPAMSAALSRLRALFDDQLFIRIGREMQPTSKAVAIAPSIFAVLYQIRQIVGSSQTFEPALAQLDFAIASSDYTSFIVVPKLIGYCSQIAPRLNFRMIGFEKDSVGNLLDQGSIDLALGVFPNLPPQTSSLSLFQEHFVGIARKEHPVITTQPISLEVFANLDHALVTIRRDTTGEVDTVLAQHNLKRRIALTIPHMLVLPSIISSSNLVACVPSRMATYFVNLGNIEVFKLPFEIQSWTVSMVWSKLADKNEADLWLRQTLKSICEQI